MVNDSHAGGGEPTFKKPRLPKDKDLDERGKSIVCFTTIRISSDSKHEEVYMRGIPSASQYEKSFMHRQPITHVTATITDFILTASVDGHLKFWKKKHAEGVEFVKHFKCHMSGFSDLTVNHNGTLLATICTEDKSSKIFDIPNFDMINILQLNFRPSAAGNLFAHLDAHLIVSVWVHQSSDIIHTLAIADADSPAIHIFDGKSNEIVHVIEGLHFKPVVKIDVRLIFSLLILSLSSITRWSTSESLLTRVE